MGSLGCLFLIFIFLFAGVVGARGRPVGVVKTTDQVRALYCSGGNKQNLGVFAEQIGEIQKHIHDPVGVEAALNEIRDSFSFFDYPVYDEGSRELEKICPKFSDMDRKNKEKFWMNFWRQLAQFESAGEMTTAKAIHGDACGYLQLHCLQEERVSAVKKPNQEKCIGDVQSNNLRAGVNSFRCGMAMLQQQVDVRGEIFPSRGKNAVYWQPIKETNKMYKKICNYKACGNTAAKCDELVRQREKELGVNHSGSSK